MKSLEVNAARMMGKSLWPFPWNVVSKGAVKGKTMTSWPSVKSDLKNAGANWVDQEVVTDGQFITSRKPDDIPAFNKAIIESIVHGVEQHATV